MESIKKLLLIVVSLFAVSELRATPTATRTIKSLDELQKQSDDFRSVKEGGKFYVFGTLKGETVKKGPELIGFTPGDQLEKFEFVGEDDDSDKDDVDKESKCNGFFQNVNSKLTRPEKFVMAALILGVPAITHIVMKKNKKKNTKLAVVSAGLAAFSVCVMYVYLK